MEKLGDTNMLERKSSLFIPASRKKLEDKQQPFKRVYEHPGSEIRISLSPSLFGLYTAQLDEVIQEALDI